MTDHTMTAAPPRSRTVLRKAMSRLMASREIEARYYLSRKFPALDRDPLASGRGKGDSLFEVATPYRS